MLYSQITAVLAFATTAIAAPTSDITKRAQTVYLAGDSTMARASGATTGWGVYLPNSLALTVVNKAIGGRSSRSYTREGRFDEIINLVQPNDIVVIEFGHNDGGGLSTDNGRSVCGGTGSETCQTTYNGVAETVHTFNWYLTEAGKKIIAKGGKVIVSSQTPNNPWESGSYNYGDGGRFVGYAKMVATALGSNAMYVDHGGYTAREMQRIGKAATDKLFPSDHTHTSPAGAELVAKTFVKGLVCNNQGGFLKGFVKTETNTVPGNCV